VEISILYKCRSTTSPLHQQARSESNNMEPSIQFVDENQRSRKSGIGGVVPLRHHSLSRKRTNSIDVRDKIDELEDPEDEDAGLRDDRDYKKKQVRNMSDFE
jgi:KUP system potassium uptake protein